MVGGGEKHKAGAGLGGGAVIRKGLLIRQCWRAGKKEVRGKSILSQGQSKGRAFEAEVCFLFSRHGRRPVRP